MLNINVLLLPYVYMIFPISCLHFAFSSCSERQKGSSLHRSADLLLSLSHACRFAVDLPHSRSCFFRRVEKWLGLRFWATTVGFVMANFTRVSSDEIGQSSSLGHGYRRGNSNEPSGCCWATLTALGCLGAHGPT